MRHLRHLVGAALCLLALLQPLPEAVAAEHVVLRNGFDLICERQESAADGRVRLYMAGNGGNFLDVNAADIALVEAAPLSRQSTSTAATPLVSTAAEAEPTAAELREMTARAGAAHNLDLELLASVIRAESGGNIHAVSRVGAQGLMQLMPGTAAELGVKDSFRPQENIDGGAAYLDQLLLRYHDNLALALAAYNAGPAAVDRYHGIPPYHETRAYVARVIHEFNRRVAAASAAARDQSSMALAGSPARHVLAP